MSNTSTTEEIKLPDVVFNGTDGKECEAFVVAIQEFAFSKGWDEDHQWLLRFAKTRLRGKALRWCARLDPPIKKDWDLFVQALFDQYPLVNDPETDGNGTPVWSATSYPSTITLPGNPEPAAKQSLPSGPVIPNTQLEYEYSHFSHLFKQPSYSVRKFDASSARQQIGLLRVVTEDETGIPQYIWRDSPEGEMIHLWCSSNLYRKVTTVNRHEALIIGFLPSSVPHQIGCLNSRAELRRLVIQFHNNSNLEYYTLQGCNDSCSLITPAPNRGGAAPSVWNVLEDGTLQASLSTFSQKVSGQGSVEEIKFTTTEVHVSCSGATIYFVKPGADFEQNKSHGSTIIPFVRARIVFEPL